MLNLNLDRTELNRTRTDASTTSAQSTFYSGGPEIVINRNCSTCFDKASSRSAKDQSTLKQIQHLLCLFLCIPYSVFHFISSFSHPLLSTSSSLVDRINSCFNLYSFHLYNIYVIVFALIAAWRKKDMIVLHHILLRRLVPMIYWLPGGGRECDTYISTFFRDDHIAACG